MIRRAGVVAFSLGVFGCGLSLDAGPAAAPDAGPLRIDASAIDAGGLDAPIVDPPPCIAEPELCNGVDDDCDGAMDEEYDVSADPFNCGACDVVCPAQGGTPRCGDGTCELVCADDRADCNGDPSDGCETDLGVPAHCGSCTTACETTAPLCRVSAAGGGFVCASDCGFGEASCDGSCVDLDTDPSHCGVCDAACFSDLHGTISCVGGDCVVTDCGDGHDDCNVDPRDGCEQSLNTNADCGMCGNACRTDEVCSGRRCAGVALACGVPMCGPTTSGCDAICGTTAVVCTRGTCTCDSPVSGSRTCSLPTPVMDCTTCATALATCCGP